MTYYTYYGISGAGSGASSSGKNFPNENPFFLGANISILEFEPVPSPGVYPGTWIPVPEEITQKMIDYGFKILRLPLRMERCQPTPNGALHEPYMLDVDAFVNYCTSRGIFVILDIHNYMERRDDLSVATKYIMGSAQFPASYFYDLWSRIADRYKTNPLVRFDLMNEPKNEVTHTPDYLITIFNGAISAIRATGSENICYTTVRSFSNASKALAQRVEKNFLQIVDPKNKTYVTLHQYFNPTASGEGTDVAQISSDQIVSYRLQQATDLARFYGKKLQLGEAGIGKNDLYTDAFYTLYDFLLKNSDVWESATLWTGGAYPDSYAYKLHPETTIIATAPPPVNTAAIMNRVGLGSVLPNETFLHWEKTLKTFGVAKIEEIFDFSRASIAWDFETSPKTDASATRKFLKTYGINEMRLISDKGLRVEPQRTNIFPSAAWKTLPNYTETNAFIDANGGAYTPYPSPDGLNTAARFNVSAVAGSHLIILGQATGLAQFPNIDHVVSIYCKTFEDYFIWLNGSDSVSGGALRSLTTLNSPNNFRKGDFTRCWVNGIKPTNANFRVRVGSNGSNAGDSNTAPASYTGTGEVFDLWQPQVEPNALFPTSPIIGVPAGGTVTRAPEIAKLFPHILAKINQNFTAILEFEDLPFHFSTPGLTAYSLPLLLINEVEALRINNDHRIAGDFVVTQQIVNPVTLAAVSGVNFGWRRPPRKYGISVDYVNGFVTLGVQGNDCVTASGTVPPITSFQLGQSGGCLSRISLLEGYKNNTELKAILLRN